MNNFCLKCGPTIGPSFEACPKCDTNQEKNLLKKKTIIGHMVLSGSLSSLLDIRIKTLSAI